MLLRHFSVPMLLVTTVFVAACVGPEDQRTVSTDSLPSSMVSQLGDRHILAGEWEYEDGGVVRLTLDEQGNGRYAWKNGRFRTRKLIGHTWHGMWVQEANDREGGFTVELSPDFTEGEGRWWYSRIGADHAPTQEGGTFHLSKKTALLNRNKTPPVP
jgi:hypothetical protein